MLWLTLQRLKVKNAKVRQEALEKLLSQPYPGHIRHVDHLINDVEIEIRKLAIKFLGATRSDRALQPLNRALRDADPDVRASAVQAITEIGEPSTIDWLVGAMKDENPNVRWHAAHALEVLGWEPRSDSDSATHIVARGEFHRAAEQGSAAIEPLVNALNAETSAKRVAAIEALSSIGDERVVKPLVTALKSRDPAVMVAALNALATIGAPNAFEPIVALIHHPDHHVRAATVETLVKLAPNRATAPLLKALRDSCWDVRKATVEALGKLKDPGTLDGLLPLLEDSDDHVREAVVVTLGKIPHERVVGPLVVRLADANSSVRNAAAAALQHVNPDWPRSVAAQEVVPELKAALKDPEYWVRQSAGDVLARIGEGPPTETQFISFTDPAHHRRRSALGVFIELLKDRDRDLRLAAAEALGRIGDPTALESLYAVRDDVDRGVRMVVEMVISELHARNRQSAE